MCEGDLFQCFMSPEHLICINLIKQFESLHQVYDWSQTATRRCSWIRTQPCIRHPSRCHSFFTCSAEPSAVLKSMSIDCDTVNQSYPIVTQMDEAMYLKPENICRRGFGSHTNVASSNASNVLPDLALSGNACLSLAMTRRRQQRSLFFLVG